ncbi:MAG: purine-binding chemotaxis protein CheW [Myxococcales bacterium]|nr:purine-binding chemotaxis protein CheW [Myxococcales bacterium]
MSDRHGIGELPVRPTPVPPAGAQGPTLYEYLVFSLDAEKYALPLRSVRELLRAPKLTRVPRAPADIAGIISVRGNITTVVDLKIRLGLPGFVDRVSPRILMVDVGSEIFGFLVDEVHYVERIHDNQIEYAVKMGSEFSHHVEGVARPGLIYDDAGVAHGDDDDILILLDPVNVAEMSRC